MIISCPKQFLTDERFSDNVSFEYPNYNFKIGDSLEVESRHIALIIQLLKDGNVVVGIVNENSKKTIEINKKNFPKLKTKFLSKDLDLQIIFINKTLGPITILREPSVYNGIGSYNIGYKGTINLAITDPELLWKKLIVEKNIYPNFLKIEHLSAIYNDKVMRILSINGYFMCCKVGSDVYNENVAQIRRSIETSALSQYSEIGVRLLPGWSLDFTALDKLKTKDYSFMNGIL